MRSLRVLPPALLAVLFAGCGYIHFGRLPRGGGDPALESKYEDLTLQQKILRQELAIARKENETLRSAVERGATARKPDSEIVQQLQQTTQELAELRVRYAKLEAERSPSAGAAESAQLAAAQQENSRLRQDLEAARAENATLAAQLKASVARTEAVEANLSQVNNDLIEQKAARDRAEQASVALRAQLEAVMARAGRSEAPPPTATPVGEVSPGPVAVSLSALQEAKAPPSDAVPRVEIRTSRARARAAAEPPSSAPASAAPVIDPASPAVAPVSTTSTSVSPAKTYTVKPGDTLEKIALRVYGSAGQWTKIYAANAAALTAAQGLKPGMELQLPEP